MNTVTFRIAMPLCALVALLALPAAADPSFDGLLDTSTIGASDFLRKYPTADGRGVAIAVLDSGVDIGVAGLSTLPDGSPRVVVARDFTREAQVDCRKAVRDAAGVVKVGQAVLAGVPADAGGQVWAGFLDEAAFRNSDVPDLNANGRTDDRFGVVVFKAAGGILRALVDVDGDGDMSDAVVLGDYEKSFETAKFSPGRPVDVVSPLTIAINLSQQGDDRVQAGFHLATGAHGTHVAGIAAGNHIAGQAGWDGVAPGSVLLSLKIGNNTLGGGATESGTMQNALRFAAEWGREHRMPVVVNLSYGIGSEIEGYSDIDSFCDRFAIENPHVVIVTSAGNEGPGMSTVGTPAASDGVISVAAVETPATAGGLTGAAHSGSVKVLAFSSRGGELAKPDVAAPGVAASTVPAWQHGDVMAGTSMASPQVAGAAALLLSAMLQQYPEAMWNSGMISRAMKAGARPVPGATALDCGAGLVNVFAAWEAFRKALSAKGASTVQFMKVETDVPTLGGRKGGAAFWRAGGWAPSMDDPAYVRVRPMFSSRAGARDRGAWFDLFVLKADRPWVRMSKSSLHFAGETDATFEIWVDPAGVAKPGVHVATVRGVSNSGLSFQFPVTVVVPWPARQSKGLPTIRLGALRVEAGGVVRIPFVVPAGTAGVAVSAVPSDGAGASVFVGVFDGGGHLVRALGGRVDSVNGASVDGHVRPSELLSAGTMELVVAGDDARDSLVDVDITFSMLNAGQVNWLKLEPGKNPTSSIEVVNNGADAFSGSFEGRIDGFETSRVVKMRGGRHEEGFSAGESFEKVEIELEISPEDWGRFTDVAVNVLDSNGKAVVHTGFTQRRLVVNVPVPKAAGQSDFRLEVRGALASSGGDDVPVSMLMRHWFRDKARLVGTVGGEGLVRLFPGVRARVGIEALSTPAAIPGDATWFGSMEFIDRRDGAVRGTVRVIARVR